MVHLYSADRAELLAERLADVLGEPPPDPMEAEWLAVPTEGMRRWLHLELARYLGASSPGAGDGVAANIIRAFPGSLRAEVVRAAGDGEPDPWRIDRMVWPLLDLFEELSASDAERPFTRLAEGASRFTRVRAVADLFDRYHLHRPEMIRAWSNGRPVDGTGAELPEHVQWEQRVWSRLRDRIGSDSPPERVPTLLAGVADGSIALELPRRIVLFGFTGLPGHEFIDLVRAVGAQRDVHLFLLGPTRFDSDLLLDAWPRPPAPRPRLRIDDPTGSVVRQPLLRSWGRVARETAILLADAGTTGVDRPVWVGTGESARLRPTTLLGRLQDDIRTNRAPLPEVVDLDDDSIRFHACFGPARQAEVVRDAVLHLLQVDTTLTEEDVLIVCPGLEQFAPLVEAAFGSRVPGAPGGGGPTLRFRIADRSMRSANPVVEALLQLLDLLDGRFERTPVMDFLSAAPVRFRYGIDDDALGAVSDWVEATYVRWGLDATHRSRFAMPKELVGNTWQVAVDRLLLGTAASDDQLLLTVGDVAPLSADMGDADALGAFATILTQLAGLSEWATSGRRPLDEWIDRLMSTVDVLFGVPAADAWQMDALRRILAEVGATAESASGTASPGLDLSDVSRLLEGKLVDEAGRPDFFRGGVTVTSLTPLRGVPFRVVCILGLDQQFAGAPAGDAADLVATAPQVGDPDRRIEWRQALLEVVLAAQEHLVVVRDGQDVRTNQEIPRAVAAAELFDAVVALAPEEQRPDLRLRLEVTHPRHPFDEDCLVPGRLLPGSAWSFDGDDVGRAEARRAAASAVRVTERPIVKDVRTEVINLSALRSFLMNPVNAFASSTLQMTFPRTEEPDDVVLPVDPGPLGTSALGRRLLEARRGGADVSAWLAFERAVGSLPPGALEHAVLGPVIQEVDDLMREAAHLGIRPGEPEYVDVDVELDPHTRIVGTVPLLLPDATPGPAWVAYTRSKPTHTLEAWIHLVALAATDHERSWQAVHVSRAKGDDPFAVVHLEMAGEGDERLHSARTALSVAVECYRAGMREPLPLFPTFSKSVADGEPDYPAWVGGFLRGDRDDAAIAYFFGHLNGTELLGLEPLEGDPPGVGGRVERWAHYLWDCVRATSREVAT